MILNHLAGLNTGRRATGGGTFTDCVNISGTPGAAGFGVYTICVKFLPGALAASGSTCRLTITGPSIRDSSISSMYIGQAATSGNAYDYDGGQAQVTFGGSSAKLLGTNEVSVSDPVTFTIDQSRSIIVAFNLDTALSALAYISGLSSNYVSYNRAGSEAASLTSKSSGYAVQANRVLTVFKIEVA